MDDFVEIKLSQETSDRLKRMAEAALEVIAKEKSEKLKKMQEWALNYKNERFLGEGI